MVRIGEYSPNFRGNRPVVEGASCGIFGEYEERRKYYNEQRKLEYKQYLAQKALNATCRVETKSTSLLPSQTSSVSFPPADTSSLCVRKEVATQTIDREQKDVSTNTNGSSYLNTMGNYPNDPRSVQRNSKEGLSSQLKEGDDHNHHRPHSFGVSCGPDLCDKSVGRRLAEKHAIREREKFQDFWCAKEDRRKLERCPREGKNIMSSGSLDSSITSVLSQLGEVRRKLATKQIEMEEALKKSKLNDEGL